MVEFQPAIIVWRFSALLRNFKWVVFTLKPAYHMQFLIVFKGPHLKWTKAIMWVGEFLVNQSIRFYYCLPWFNCQKVSPHRVSPFMFSHETFQKSEFTFLTLNIQRHNTRQIQEFYHRLDTQKSINEPLFKQHIHFAKPSFSVWIHEVSRVFIYIYIISIYIYEKTLWNSPRPCQKQWPLIFIVGIPCWPSLATGNAGRVS